MRDSTTDLIITIRKKKSSNGFLGKKHTDEVKQKISNSCKGLTRNKKLSKEDVSYIKNSKENAKFLSRKFGVSVSTIYRIR